MNIVKDERLKEEAKILFRFLKDYGAYMKYRKYIFCPNTYNRVQKDNPDWSFENTLKTYGLYNMVTILITWDKTDEGFEFWADLHAKFRNYVRKIKSEASAEKKKRKNRRKMVRKMHG